MKISLEEIMLVKELREKGVTDREIAFLLVRKTLTTDSLISLYEQKYGHQTNRV